MLNVKQDVNNVQEWIIKKEIIKIGRGEKNDICISGVGVSYDHCHIEYAGSKLVMLNMCRNTWVDGVRIEAGVFVEIAKTNEVMIGRELFHFVPVDVR